MKRPPTPDQARGRRTFQQAGQALRLPPQGAYRIQDRLGSEQITLIASDAPFAPGEPLRGNDVAERVVHRDAPAPDPARTSSRRSRSRPADIGGGGAVETLLHRQLKARFGTEAGGRSEVEVGGFRIDAIAPDGQLVEVQSGALGPLRGKLTKLLGDHRVRVIKPVVVSRRIVRRARRDGPDLSARLSPRRGEAFDVFDDLVGLAQTFPHPRLSIDVLAVAIDEVRVPRRRRPGHEVIDRFLRQVVRTIPLQDANDLWTLLPDALPDPFTTLDLAERLRRPIAFAQRVAYCLRLSGAAKTRGKAGRRQVYSRSTA